jgi:predicted acylesterase/phospholipase RssA
MSTSHLHKTSFFQTCLGVFQGGGCRAAAFVGAYESALAHGVHFAEVAGTSAGSIVASLIGAGATPEQLKESIRRLDFRTLMLPPEPIPSRSRSIKRFLGRGTMAVLRATQLRQLAYFYSHLGMHSSLQIERWMEQELRQLLPNIGNRPIRFSDLLIPTWVIATDLKTGGVRIWSSRETGSEEVSPAIRASCSIPVFFQPVQFRYVDGGALSNLPSFVFANPKDGPLSNRILAFALKAQDEEPDLFSAAGMVKAMLNAVVDGSRDLQLKMQRNVHVVSISTGAIKATDFDKMNHEVIGFLEANGRQATHEFFQDELSRVQTDTPPPGLCHDTDEMYAAIVENLDRPIKDILIAEEKTDWVYSLFPSLLFWRFHGVRIRVLLNQTGDNAQHGPYRRRLLRALGVEVIEVPAIPFKAYLFDSNDVDRASAIVGIPSSTHAIMAAATRYSRYFDGAVINSLRRNLESFCPETVSTEMARIVIEKTAVENLLEVVRRVPQYEDEDVELSMKQVKVDHLILLTSHVREFKYRQIRRLLSLYEKSKIQWFEPSRINFGNGYTSLITPPIAEESGDGYVLIEGSTRATFCRDNGIENILIVVAKSVKQALPSDERVGIRQVLITRREIPILQRYGPSYNRQAFRPVEKAVHPVDSLI